MSVYEGMSEGITNVKRGYSNPYLVWLLPSFFIHKLDCKIYIVGLWITFLNVDLIGFEYYTFTI